LSAAVKATNMAPENKEMRDLRGSIKARDFGLEYILIGRALEESVLSEKKSLRNAKFFLLNGETELARQTLNNLLKNDKSKHRGMLHRYMAIAYFQEARWKDALNSLSTQELSVYPHYGKICPLKIITRIALKDKRDLMQEWNRCKKENAKDVLKNDVVWMETLVRLASDAPKGTAEKAIRSTNLRNMTNEQMRSMLKLALFLNLETKLIDQLELLDYEAINDEELRGLVAHIYFRQGRLAEAWRFMQDIAHPNVENMKGNLWLLRGNEELAYAQFKLALKQKSNSHNAVERALPLAWSLKQWKEGHKLSERIYTHEKNRLQRLTTTAAFAVAQEEWNEALTRLETVHQQSGVGTALEVSQLSTYVALRQNDAKRLHRYSLLSCEAGDLMSCWIQMTKLTWEDLPSMLKREDSSALAEPIWRTLASQEVEEFKEESYIDQRDIDELDDALIKLTK
jgi:hypothetical protein